MKRFFAFACLALSLSLQAGYAHAVLVNFDSVDASAGAVTGAPVVSYLAGFGITLIAPNLTPTILQTQGNQVPAPSLPNYFGVGGPGTGFFYTFEFASPVNSVSFTTPALGSGSTMAEFSATAYDAANQVLSQVSRRLSGPNVPQATWTLNGPNIDHIVFFSNVQNFAGSNLIFDDFTFTPVVPILTCTGFSTPFAAPILLKAKVNRAIPVKMQLFDNGTPITDANIAGAAPVVNVSFAPGGGPAVDVTDQLEPLGQSSDGNEFRYDPAAGQWIFNFGTKVFSAAGTYTVSVKPGDTSYDISPTCMGQFVRAN